jgi:hypothetical protein
MRFNRDWQNVVPNVSSLSPSCDGCELEALVSGALPNHCLYSCCGR